MKIRSVCLLAAAFAMTATGEERERGDLTHPLAKETANYPDLCATAAGIGIDYPKILDQALAGNERAIGLLFWFGEHGGTDAAATEGYSFTLLKTLKLLGDEKITNAARKHGPATFSMIRAFLAFEYGSGNEEEKALRAVAEEFPMLWKLMGQRNPADLPANR